MNDYREERDSAVIKSSKYDIEKLEKKTKLVRNGNTNDRNKNR